MARMTMSTRNVVGVTNMLRRYGSDAQLRVKAAVSASMDRTYATAQDLCPRDTGFMAEHMHADPTPSGFGYEVGWEASEFEAAGKAFYPVFTEFSTRFMPAQPCLFPARDAEAPRFKRELREALRPTRR